MKIKIFINMLIVMMGIMLLCPQILMAGEKKVVLVTSEKSLINRVTIIEVRRIYLGLRIENGNNIVPVLNISDEKIYREFVKNIMRTTVRRYERNLVKNIFRKGADKITKFDDKSVLIEYLHNNPGIISFLDVERERELDGLKVLLTLW